MVLGLVHDIGRVALLRHSGLANFALARLQEGGVAPLYAEELLFGAGHGEIGAAILQDWGFAPDIVEAVSRHHHPGECDSPAAAALYLAEFWAATDEDLPSARHLNAAQRRLGCSIEMLSKVGRGKTPLSDILKVA
jgi:HD-like signal output (HDOD) protein